MGAYLVVAHRTLVEDHLLDHVRSLCEASDCRFHLVVPVTHPRDHAWTDGEVTAAARRRLDEGIEAFGASGAEVTGEVGDANPVYAVATALRASGDVDDASAARRTMKAAGPIVALASTPAFRASANPGGSRPSPSSDGSWPGLSAPPRICEGPPASLRAVPGLVVLRPADANETAAAWRTALARRDGP